MQSTYQPYMNVYKEQLNEHDSNTENNIGIFY